MNIQLIKPNLVRGLNSFVNMFTLCEDIFVIPQFKITFTESSIVAEYKIEGEIETTNSYCCKLNKSTKNSSFVINLTTSETNKGYYINGNKLILDNGLKSWELIFKEDIKYLGITSSGFGRFKIGFIINDVIIEPNTIDEVNELKDINPIVAIIKHKKYNQRYHNSNNITDYLFYNRVDVLTNAKLKLNIPNRSNLFNEINKRISKREFKDFFEIDYEEIQNNILVRYFESGLYEKQIRLWCYLHFLSNMFIYKNESGDVMEYLCFIVSCNKKTVHYSNFLTDKIEDLLLIKGMSLYTNKFYKSILELVPVKYENVKEKILFYK